jgi:hypothetical protein
MSKADHFPARPAQRGQALAVLALAMGLAACSSAGSATSGQGSAASPSTAPSAPARTNGPTVGAVFTGTIYVSTATTHVTRPFVYRDTDVASCAAAAKSGDANGTFRVPTGRAPDPQALIEVAGFHGPGTYTPAMLRHDRQDVILLPSKSVVGIGQYFITSPVAGRAPGKEVLFLNKDGSGQFVYSDAHLNGLATNPAVAGVVQWTCKS